MGNEVVELGRLASSFGAAIRRQRDQSSRLGDAVRQVRRESWSSGKRVLKKRERSLTTASFGGAVERAASSGSKASIRDGAPSRDFLHG
jgi:hypothetical protein